MSCQGNNVNRRNCSELLGKILLLSDKNLASLSTNPFAISFPLEIKAQIYKKKAWKKELPDFNIHILIVDVILIFSICLTITENYLLLILVKKRSLILYNPNMGLISAMPSPRISVNETMSI